ncbi:MAG: thiamine-phosphate kinase [Gammaproteobacteria bacterium]|nr:thiamine-phosphate kinase [Gammaproteobacteria bacterium]
MSEFNLINDYFKSMPVRRKDVVLGIGDDCAILEVAEGKQLAVSTDTLIEGTHFPRQTSARNIGYKSLAVNLSDLAAMGAEPAWVSLALTLPEENPVWLKEFSEGFSELANSYQLQLIGGDTTRGPLSITIQIFGFVNKTRTLRRDAAQPGDLIYLSGTLGDAGLGLDLLLNQSQQTEQQFLIERLNRPQPRITTGKELVKISQCAIDVSDGLSADLGHICEQSNCGAEIKLADLPLSKELKAFYGADINWNNILSSGDDYELCFTIRPEYQDQIKIIEDKLNVKLSCIGKITPGAGIKYIDKDNRPVQIADKGYDHFNK